MVHDLLSNPLLLCVYVLAFGCVFIAAQTAIGFALTGADVQRGANARLRLTGRKPREKALKIMRRRRGLDATGALQGPIVWLNALILHSGVSVSPARLGAIMAAFAAGAGAAAFFYWGHWAAPLAAAPVGIAAPIYYLKYKRGQRQTKVSQQLPDALEVIVRSLAAGHPVPAAINLVGREMADPIGSEFGMAADEISYGASLSDAVGKLAWRVGDPDVDLVAALVRLQERTGGNLADLLKVNARTIRERQKMRLKIKAASSEARMSAIILSATPIVVFILVQLVSPEFYGEVMHERSMQIGLAAIGFWLVLGNVIIRKMISFRI